MERVPAPPEAGAGFFPDDDVNLREGGPSGGGFTKLKVLERPKHLVIYCRGWGSICSVFMLMCTPSECICSGIVSWN